MPSAKGEGSIDPEEEAPGARTVVWLLFALYVLSLLDRGLFALFVEPIRIDLALTDSQVALVKGFAFAMTYTMLGLPFGWIADRSSRRLLLAITTAIWAVATFIFGLAAGFLGLFLGRALLGLGEAALTPTAHSLIGDMVRRDRLTLALSIFSSAAVVGAGLSYLVGGILYSAFSGSSINLPVVGQLVPWRATFLTCGIVGFVFAFLPLLIREPARRARAVPTGARSGFGRFLLDNRRAVAFHLGAFSVVSIMNNALTAWIPTYLIRNFSWSVERVAYSLALWLPVAGVVSYVLSVRLIARLGRSGPDAHFRFYTAACLVCAAIAVSAFTLPHDGWSFLLLINLAQMAATYPVAGLAAASLQLFTPPEARGRMAALFLLVFSLVGQGLGPLCVALLTDHVFHDRMMLGRAMMVTLVCFGPLGALLFHAGRPSFRAAVVDAARRQGGATKGGGQ